MTLNELLMIVGMLTVTFGVRYPVLALLGRMELPAWLQRALRFVPVAVLSAIAAPMVLLPGGEWHLSFDNAALIGALVAIVMAWKYGHLLLTIVTGMAAFAVWKFFV